MWMCPEIQLAAPRIGYVRVELCSGEIGVAEHFLNGSEVGASLEQVSREGVPKDVRVNASGLQPCHPGETAEDQEGPGPRERSTFGVQEQLRPVAPVEVRTAPRQVAAHGV